MMMAHDEDETAELSPDAVDELLEAQDEEEEEVEEPADTIDEFGAGGDEDIKTRDWE